MSTMMSVYQMGRTGSETKFAQRIDCGFGDARIRRQPEIIVAAKRQIVPAIDPDVRALRGFEQATPPAQTLPIDLGEFGNQIAHRWVGSRFDDRTKHRIPSAGADSVVADSPRLDDELVRQLN